MNRPQLLEVVTLGLFGEERQVIDPTKYARQSLGPDAAGKTDAELYRLGARLLQELPNLLHLGPATITAGILQPSLDL